MNALDVLLGVLMLSYTIRGVRRGMVLGLIDLVGVIVAFTVSLAGFPGLSPILARFSGLEGDAADLAAFFSLFFLFTALYVLVTRTLLSRFRARRLSRPLRRANHLLGVVPGVIQAVVVAALFATAVGVLPASASIAAQSRNSVLAPFFEELGSRLAPVMEQRLAVSSPQLLHRLNAPGNTERENLDFPKGLTVSTVPTSEMQMLALVNQERAAHALRPLEMDEQLRAVARAHSAEMFELSFFAHVSPRTGSPIDRLTAARVRFLLTGENLAYQSDVVTAHRELMDSPGHRRNVLSPLYERIGIGVVDGGSYGHMYTQEFAD